MMQKIQRFGAAMFVPVLLFSFSGIVVALCTLFENPVIFGNLAAPTTPWYKIWNTIADGGWTIFRQEGILFTVGLPIGLANKARGRAAMEAVIGYLTYNYFIFGMLTNWGGFFGIPNFTKIVIAPNATNNGLTNIAGIKTLDTSILGALIVALIVVWLHNRYFDKKLPDWLGTFQGSVYVYFLSFFILIPVAFLTCLIWPKIQLGINNMQHIIVKSGAIGIWIYEFLNRILIPTGLHHLVYIPFQYGPAVVAGGLQQWWLDHLAQFAANPKPLSQIANVAGFQIYGNEKVFLVPFICLAFYSTAKKNKKKQTSALLIPAALTSIFGGITEPIDFTYLFAAPILWVIYSVLSATMNTVMWLFGLRGEFSGGFIMFTSQNWLPLWQYHWQVYVIQWLVGISFGVLTYFIFRFMILRYNYITPGREADNKAVELINKKQYQAKKAEEASGKKSNGKDPYRARATAFLKLLGGSSNISEMSSCATRLRVTVNDPEKVGTDAEFKANKAISVVRHGKALQVIVGLDVPQVLDEMTSLMGHESNDSGSTTINTKPQNPIVERATAYVDLLGGSSNIENIIACSTRVRAHVIDLNKIGTETQFKKFGAHALQIKKDEKRVDIVDGINADQVVDEMHKLL